ncbi:MAG TPA: ATP-dependent DNA helicase, partial [Candidatus Sulfotelmatobacter sp.]|nr:ATP-dependent DNA helicase [Candidatus Sulfotelmatobacter sp.]
GRAAVSLVEFLGRVKQAGISPERYETHAAALVAAARQAAAAPEEAARDGLEAAEGQLVLARAFGAYQRLLAEAGCLDFGDQIALAVRLLEEHASVREALRQRYRYVLVDEFQDTDPAQLRLLAALVGPRGSVTAVGDDDQAIYGFRGAGHGATAAPLRLWPTATTIRLRRNYRSRRPILAAAARLIGHADGPPDGSTPRRPLVAHRRVRPRPVRCEGFATADAEAAWIADLLAERAARGLPLREMAVLVRRNRDAEPVLQALANAGLATRASTGHGLLRRPEVRELLAFLRVVADPSSTLDLYALATAEPYHLGGADLTLLLEMARRRHRPLWDVFRELLAQPGIARVEDATRAAVKRLVGDLEAACAAAHRRPAPDVLYDHLRRSGRLARLARQPDGDLSVQAVVRLFTLVRELAAVLPDDRLAFVAPHLDLLAEASGDDVEDDGPLDERDAVAVLTVHKAKGLEFSLVVVAGLAEGRFPIRGRAAPFSLPAGLVGPVLDDAASPAADAEERRLAYVAMTRARDELVLTWSERTRGGRVARPSPFLGEALDRPIARPAALESQAALAALEPVAGEPLAAGPVRPSAPRELSFSQLDSYLTCPAQYRYRYVTGLPTPSHHALVYGSALHAAVAAYHLSERRGRPLDEPTLLAAFGDHWRAEGFLSRAHEDARYAAGQAALRRFRTDRLASGDPPPTAVEASFSVRLGEDRLRGRYDRLDAGPAGTVITDYKSGDVPDLRRARQRARDSLQLALYALAYEAETGALPAVVQLHFLTSQTIGAVAPEPARLARARARLTTAAAGIRRGAFEPTPDPMTCAGCPFREICPSSAA